MNPNDSKEKIAAKMISIFGEQWEESQGWGWIRHKELPYIHILYIEQSGDFKAIVDKDNEGRWAARTKNPERILKMLVDVMQKSIDEDIYVLEKIKGITNES